MPQRAEDIRRAHLSDVMDALRDYVEQGHAISLETAYIAEDRGTITIGIDLSLFHPILSEASRQRFGQEDGRSA